MTAKTYLKITVALLLAAALVVTVTVLLVPRLLDFETSRARLLAMVQQTLNRPVSYQSASLSWQFGPSIVFRGLTIGAQPGTEPLLQVEKLAFTIDLLPLLRKEVHLRGVIVQHPDLVLTRDSKGALNVQDLLTPGEPGPEVRLGEVRVQQGRIRFVDRLHDPGGFVTELEHLDLSMESLARGKTAALRLAATVTGDGGTAQLSISGTVRIPTRNETVDGMKLDLKIVANHLDLGGYWGYYGNYLPCEPLRGVLNIEQTFTGTPSDFATKGRLLAKGLRVKYSAVFPATLTPGEVRLAYDIERTPRSLAMKALDLNVDGLRVTGNCSLDDLQTDDPRINARAAIPPFRLQEYRQYIPYGVIDEDVAEFIKQRITGGVFRLDEGRLEGRLSRITHMEQGDNSDALLVRARVEQGILTLGTGIPPIENITGSLEMRGKDFNLVGMRGTFGSSPFTLDGKIADYPLATPSSYPFTMDITPGAAEVAWLLRHDVSSDFSFLGTAPLHLAGSGTASDYRIDGDWDLSGADYRYRQLLHKPAGMANRLRFDLRLGESGAELPELRYDLPPFAVTADAAYRYDDPSSLSFNLNTNRFAVDPLVRVVPGLERYHPSGSVRIALGTTGKRAATVADRLQGTVDLDSVSLRPVAQIKPLSDIGGTVALTGTGVQTERLSGSIGRSPFTVRGRLSGWSDPAISLAFSLPQLHLEDFGLQATGRAPEVKQVAGEISLKGESLAISSLSGVVNHTSFSTSGQVHGGDAPQVALKIDFPSLRLEDLESLAGVTRAGKTAEPVPDITLQAEVTAATGSAREIPFEQLATTLSLHGKLLEVRAFRAGLFGGTLSGSGQADFSAGQGPEYRATYRLEHLDADRILGAAGLPPRLGGPVSAEGSVTARGSSREELERTARFDATVLLSNGVLRLPPQTEPKADRNVPIKEALAVLLFGDRKLTIHRSQVQTLGGVVSGAGSVVFGQPDGNGYHLACQMTGIDAEAFLDTFDVTNDLTGRLSLQTELDARGDNVDALGKTLQGSLKVQLEKGVIKRYGVISRVFTLLNINGIVDFSARSGMPYDTIHGSYVIRNGVISTPDLTVHSPSLNTFMIGSADIPNRTVDVKIAVHLFQTFGKIVNRIPIIGWILTGGKKRISALYYEAKGNWSNPTITSRTSSELPVDVYNIFRRIFELPENIMKEPEKVFMGS